MTRSFTAALAILTLLASASLLPEAANAHDYKAKSLVIDHPWVRPSLGRVPNSAAYMTIKNTGAQDDRLVAASTDAAQVVELHTHINDNGIMRMREVEGGIALPAGETVAFKPGGLHIMLIGLTQRLEKGGLLPMTLTFEKAGKIEIVAIIEMGAARGSHSGAQHSSGDGHDHGHGHGDHHSH